MKKLSVPHPYVIIMILIILATVLTYVLPAGQFERYQDPSTGRTLVSPGSYEAVPNTPVNLFKALQAIPEGLIEGASIIMIVFVYGGSFGIINGTGAIDIGIENSVETLSKISFLLIPAMMILFSFLGAYLGIAESTLAFIPLCVSLAKSLGYDAIVGFAIVNLGNLMGFTAGPMNMWTTGVAQGIAELPLFSGLGARMILYVLLMVLAIGYVLIYARRIKQDPTKSLMYTLEQQRSGAGGINVEKIAVREFTSRKKATLALTGVGFVGLIVGIILQKLTGNGIGAYLLGMAIVVALFDGSSPNKISEDLIVGVKNVAMGGVVIGLARAILIILTNGNIVDTILNVASQGLANFSPIVAAIMMLIFQFFFNFVIPSGSGQAATTMPLMVPLADMAGISRQTAVLAFQLGDGLSNSLWPTSGGVMAGLSMADIPYNIWLKFYGPYIGIFFVISTIFVAVCTGIGLGPF